MLQCKKTRQESNKSALHMQNVGKCYSLCTGLVINMLLKDCAVTPIVNKLFLSYIVENMIFLALLKCALKNKQKSK